MEVMGYGLGPEITGLAHSENKRATVQRVNMQLCAAKPAPKLVSHNRW